MDSESKAKDVNESDVSRFTLDGVVAEMVIEVDEEPISPTKILDQEKYEVLKASALRKSSVVLDSKLNTGVKCQFVKEIESDFGKSEESENNIECNVDLISNVIKDKFIEDSEPISDTNAIVSTIKCAQQKQVKCSEDEFCEDLVDEKLGNFKSQSKVPEGNQSESEKCDTSEVLEEIENLDHNALLKQGETVKENQRELEIKNPKKFGKRQSRVSGKKESKVFKTIPDAAGDIENFKRSSNRTKAKDVAERGTSSNTNLSTEEDRISQNNTVSDVPENKKNVLRGRFKTNVVKSEPTKLTIQNKKTAKTVTVPEIKTRGQKRQIQDPAPVKEDIAKKPKQMENATESKLQLKPSRTISTSSEASTSKRHSLRKPLSTAAVSAKLKPFNLYPKSDCRLDSFVEVKEQLDVADLKYLRALYRIMYDRWPPRDLEELKKEILQFQGFTFNKKSEELEKRQQVLKKLPDASVLNICKILDLKVGKKDSMISGILKFLLKPVKVIFSPVDPFQPSMQPVVKLEKVPFGRVFYISI